MSRPLLLDLFCGAGGCAAGYHRAGFDVVGVDHRPQPHYPFEFVRADALEYVASHGKRFDVVHASPPCQAYSIAKSIHKRKHPDLVGPTRDLLRKTGRLYIMENVPGAPLRFPIMLCGTFFSLKVIRHRYFESNSLLLAPAVACNHPPRGSVVQTGRPVSDGQFMVVAGHFSNLLYARKAMGIDWMTRDELSQAIPPAYTEFIGKQLIFALENGK